MTGSSRDHCPLGTDEAAAASAKTRTVCAATLLLRRSAPPRVSPTGTATRVRPAQSDFNHRHTFTPGSTETNAAGTCAALRRLQGRPARAGVSGFWLRSALNTQACSGVRPWSSSVRCGAARAGVQPTRTPFRVPCRELTVLGMDFAAARLAASMLPLARSA